METIYFIVEKILYPIVDKVPSRMKITYDMLAIIESINKSALANNHVLVSFDVANIFPNIDN